MADGVLIWMVLFVIFAIVFFGVAAIVSVKGVADIKELMNDPELNEDHD